jgi:Abortive infection alpha
VCAGAPCALTVYYAPRVGEEVELATKTAGEVVAALAETSGVTLVPKEYASYIAARVHYRHYPKLVERALRTAEKIKAAGLPAHAYSALDDPLLTAILEGVAEEEEGSLQQVWENLLANVLTDSSAEVRRAFPRILRELDPQDVRLLDHFAGQTTDERYLVDTIESLPGVRDGVARGTTGPRRLTTWSRSE